MGLYVLIYEVGGITPFRATVKVKADVWKVLVTQKYLNDWKGPPRFHLILVTSPPLPCHHRSPASSAHPPHLPTPRGDRGVGKTPGSHYSPPLGSVLVAHFCSSAKVPGNFKGGSRLQSPETTSTCESRTETCAVSVLVALPAGGADLVGPVRRASEHTVGAEQVPVQKQAQGALLTWGCRPQNHHQEQWC